MQYYDYKSYPFRAASSRALSPRVQIGVILISEVAENTAIWNFKVEVELRPLVTSSKRSGLAGSRHISVFKEP